MLEREHEALALPPEQDRRVGGVSPSRAGRESGEAALASDSAAHAARRARAPRRRRDHARGRRFAGTAPADEAGGDVVGRARQTEAGEARLERGPAHPGPRCHVADRVAPVEVGGERRGEEGGDCATGRSAYNRPLLPVLVVLVPRSQISPHGRDAGPLDGVGQAGGPKRADEVLESVPLDRHVHGADDGPLEARAGPL